MIQRYQNSSASTGEFTPFVATLRAIEAGTTHGTGGLSGYCDAWKKACQNAVFRQLQVDMMKGLYYQPSQAWTQELLLQQPVSMGQLYDAAVQHGVQGNDSLTEIIQSTPRRR